MTVPKRTRNAREIESSGAPSFGFRPLYAQIRDLLMNRIAGGEWPPGHALPSEIQIAAELGVSQGTVRKALDAMTEQQLLVRRQGRGTFVARHDDARIMFQFFRLKLDRGETVFPESETRGVQRGRATADEMQRLDLSAKDIVIRIRRVRFLAGEACISEYICLPQKIFAAFSDADIPNNLYNAFSAHHGVTIATATERIRAVALADQDAAALGMRAGMPALEIDRIAIALDNRKAEWRRSICRTDRFHYLNELR